MSTERRSLGASRRGYSLIELIVVIVVLGVGIAGLTSLFAMVTRESADPMLRKQALAVAEGLMQEIQLKRFCTAACTPSALRADFDEVQDYAGYATNGVRTIDGATIPGLERYNVAVTVTNASFGSATLTVPAPAAVLITVTVSYHGGSVALSGYRTAYAADA